MNNTVKIWDPLVRVFHVALAITFFVAYFTEDDFMTLHAWSGYAVGGIVLLRIAWGFVGPKHARFSDFLFGPWRTLKYLKALLSGNSERYLGHSPAGAIMVFVLLATLLALVWTGLEVYAIEENAGPLAGVSASIVSVAHADDDGEKGDDGDFYEDIHEFLANFTLVLIALHVLGVLLASAAHKENLTWSMLTGRKRKP